MQKDGQKEREREREREKKGKDKKGQERNDGGRKEDRDGFKGSKENTGAKPPRKAKSNERDKDEERCIDGLATEEKRKRKCRWTVIEGGGVDVSHCRDPKDQTGKGISSCG